MHRERPSVLACRSAVLLVLLAGCRVDSPPPPLSPSGEVKPALEAATLALDKQEHIWDVEHAAFELEQKFGKSLGQALVNRDPDAIAGFCREGFEVFVPSSGEVATRDLGFMQSVRLEASDAKSSRDPADFANLLHGYFKDFEKIDKVTCRVLDLHADNDDAATGFWDASLYLAGVGWDDEQAFLEFTSEHRLRCYFTSDEAVESGTILDQWSVRFIEHRRSPGALFEEVTEESGLSQVDLPDNWTAATDKVRQYHTQMAAADFDRDGFYDLALASANGRWRLLRSVAGKKFEEVNDQLGLPSWTDEEPRSRSRLDDVYLATWIDIDNDGFSDLILGDRLYRNLEGRRFEDVTDQSGLVFGHNPRGCVVADYDCDGRLDLYVLYQHPQTTSRDGSVGWVGDDQSGRENHLWKNMGDGRFENTTDLANAGGGKRQSFAASWLHANEDHYPDLYIANDFGTNVLLINRGNGSFRDASAETGVADYATSMGVAAGDITGDGRPDIYVANMFSKMGRRIIAHVAEEDYPAGIFQQIQGSCAGNRLYTPGEETGRYQEVSEVGGVNTVGWAYAPALADFDADGQLDIYATTGFLSYQRGKPDG